MKKADCKPRELVAARWRRAIAEWTARRIELGQQSPIVMLTVTATMVLSLLERTSLRLALLLLLSLIQVEWMANE